jgi:hypothetical protein
MRRTLGEHAPVVVCELHGTGPEVRAFFEGFDYRVDALPDDSLHLRALPRGRA